MPRFNPAFAATFRPGSVTAPLAERVIARMFRSSTRITSKWKRNAQLLIGLKAEASSGALVSANTATGTSGLPRHVRDFPFPLIRDSCRYQANLEPAPARHETDAGSWGGTVMNAGPDYADFTAERGHVLARNPGMLVTPPHMRAAEWDTLRYVMRRLAAEYPGDFGLTRGGPLMRWVNHRLGVSLEFTPSDDGSLPYGPLEYIGRQVVEDLVLLDQREGHLWVDGGLVTFASGWSFPFIAGMSFREIHGPIPRGNPDGVFTRAEEFLLRLQPGECYRRVSWALQSGRVLDRSVDSYARWLPDAARFAAALGTADEPDLGEGVSLRVEVQHLISLERASPACARTSSTGSASGSRRQRDRPSSQIVFRRTSLSRKIPCVIHGSTANAARGLLVGRLHSQQGDVLRVVAVDWPAQDDDAFLHEAVHERGMLVPVRLLAVVPRVVPASRLGRQHRGHWHLQPSSKALIPSGPGASLA
jgi:hypothetical protein